MKDVKIVSGYMSWLFNGEVQKSVETFGETFHAKYSDKYNGIVVTGLSGTLFGSILSYTYNIPLTVVRKPDDNSTHSIHKLEGATITRWLFVDDFIGQGGTLKRVLKEVRNEYPTSTCVGAYLGHYHWGLDIPRAIDIVHEELGTLAIHNLESYLNKGLE